MKQTGSPVEELLIEWEDFDRVLPKRNTGIELVEVTGYCDDYTSREFSCVRKARDFFIKGDLVKLQIHYRFAKQGWIATYTRRAVDIRLVRIKIYDLD